MVCSLHCKYANQIIAIKYLNLIVKSKPLSDQFHRFQISRTIFQRTQYPRTKKMKIIDRFKENACHRKLIISVTNYQKNQS